MEKLTVFVAVHKEVPFYGNNCYKFLHVGASKSSLKIKNAVRDNAAEDNISDKNRIYCELTGLYYIWKNIKDIENVGLCHYRRFLAKKPYGSKPKNLILKEEQILKLLQKCDVILPMPANKKGVINGFFKGHENELEDYRPYNLVLPVIQSEYPDFIDDFKIEFFTKKMSFGNIMICRKSLFDEYCQWLFNILFKVEESLKNNGGHLEPREMGYFSEWLLNVWIRHKKLAVSYVPLYFIQPTNNLKYQLKKIIYSLCQVLK